ncbi:PREDICTED: uncharacterized protein LOC104753484 [Camelina sativa]|uniref:Uncharacterized protein LOC104753484 n=1 Tax=Camelina sativa TaxID=90675 RepID=A0ABM0WP79_CAMSA|nr:PREDICTED: uncharacterized protein LOC104753484 [Camelina sativa]
MDSGLNEEPSGASGSTVLKRNSNDIAWEYEMLSDSKNLDKVKCKLCGKDFSGGAYRIKEHIAKIPGNVSAFQRSSKDDQEKCKTAIEEAKKKNKKKVTLDDELRQTVNVHGSGDMDDVIELEEMGSRKMQRTLEIIQVPMDSGLNEEPSGASGSTVLKRNSNDIAWEYEMLSDSKNLDKVKCKLCGKDFSGGAYRIKEHIAKIPGNVSAFQRSSKDDQEKCKTAIEEAKKKNKKKVTLDDELRQTVNVHGSGDMDDVIELEEMGSRKMQRTLGPMDKFATNINPKSRPPTRQQNINDALWKEKLHKVQQYIARWVYASGVPFNTIANDEFKLMAESIGQFGPGVTPPSQHQLREPLLKEEVDRVHGLLKPQEEEWKKNGCTVMKDA